MNLLPWLLRFHGPAPGRGTSFTCGLIVFLARALNKVMQAFCIPGKTPEKCIRMSSDDINLATFILLWYGFFIISGSVFGNFFNACLCVAIIP
jgi:hypothetical protein